MARIPLPDLDNMTEGASSGILELANFAIKFNQNLAQEKNRERSQAAGIMTNAAQGITVNSSQEDIEGAIDFINSTAGEDPVKQDYAESTNQRLKSVLEQRTGMDNFISTMKVTKDKLRDVTKKGREGIYDSSGALKIMENLESNYLDNIRHASKQPGLATMYKNDLNEARDVYNAISLMEQLDAVKYVENETATLFMQLPKDTKDLPVKWQNQPVSRDYLSQLAQTEFDANNFTKASKILGTMLVDSQGRGMKLASDVRALNPYYDTANKQLTAISKDGLVDSEYPVIPVINDLISNANANMILSPQEIKSAFNTISQYIYDVAKDEETFEGVFWIGDAPESIIDLDRYLNDNRERLLKELDSTNLSKAVENILYVREGLARAYKEAYGEDLIIEDEDLQIIF